MSSASCMIVDSSGVSVDVVIDVSEGAMVGCLRDV